MPLARAVARLGLCLSHGALVSLLLSPRTVPQHHGSPQRHISLAVELGTQPGAGPMPCLASLRLPSTHLLFSTPGRGQLGPQGQDSTSAGLTPSCFHVRGSEGAPGFLPLRAEEGQTVTGVWQEKPDRDTVCVSTGGTRTRSGQTDPLDLPLALFLTAGKFQNSSEIQAPHLQNEGNNTRLVLL